MTEQLELPDNSNEPEKPKRKTNRQLILEVLQEHAPAKLLEGEITYFLLKEKNRMASGSGASATLRELAQAGLVTRSWRVVGDEYKNYKEYGLAQGQDVIGG